MHGTIGALAARQAIAELKARYFRVMDTRDWALMADVFTNDAVMDMRAEARSLADHGLPVDSEGGLIEGRDAIVAAMAGPLEGTISVHHGHMGEIELAGDGEAGGVWAMEDVLILPPGAPRARLHGFGHYHERYRRGGDGRWRIASLRLTRLWRDA